MSGARDAILERIRVASPSADTPGAIAAAAQALVADPVGCRPGSSDRTLLDRFIEKATSDRVTATVEQIGGVAELPAAVVRYLTRAGLAPQVALQPTPALTGRDWVGAGIAPHVTLTPDEVVAVSWAEHGIAETGSVVFRSGPTAPVLTNFLPLHHLVVVRADTMLAHLEDAFRAVGLRRADQPRNLCLITGTSGTADIEAVNVRGAHGPRFMHIVILTNP